MEDYFKPYLDKESAIEWLRRHLENNDVDIKAMYHLEIINKFINHGKEILKRFPSQALGGLSEGGRRNVQAAALCRADETASEGSFGRGTEKERQERTERLIANWARRDGSWTDCPEADMKDSGKEFIGSGAEADVFRKDNATVCKIISTVFFMTPQEALDRITLQTHCFRKQL